MKQIIIGLIILVTPFNLKAQETIDLFILAGQSNAQGWTGDAAQYPQEDIELDASILFNWTFFNKESSNGEWEHMQAQKGRFPAGHFGLEVSFSRALKKAGFNPSIFKYSQGATGLSRDWKKPGENGIYDHMAKDLKAAIEDLERQNYKVVIRGFIWIQGESDAGDDFTANNYQKNLELLLDDLRKNVLYDDEFKIILGVDEQHGFVKKRPIVVEAQKNIANKDPNIVFTSMYGLPKADATHLTPEGLVQHGQRIFNAYKKLNKNRQEIFTDNLISIDQKGGIIHFFPENQKEAKLSRFQFPGKQLWMDATRIDGKTQQIRITAYDVSRKVRTLVKFKYPFGDASVTWNMEVDREGDIVSVLINPWNGTLIGERMDANEGGDESEIVRKKLGTTGAALTGLPLLYSSGNSISLGYWPYLEGELWRDVNVYYQRELWKDMPETRSPNNGIAHNAYESLEKAYKNELFKPDYILINFGLHMVNGHHDNMEGYGVWVQKFIDVAKAHNAKLIWVTTTPYALFREDKNSTVRKFNETATKIIHENNMYVVDLYSCITNLIKERNEWNVYEDGVHFREDIKSRQGEFLAQQILKIVEKVSVEKPLDKNKLD